MSTKKEIEYIQNGGQGREIFEHWARIMNKMNRSEKIPRDFGTGDLLFPSEIHTLCVIGAEPGTNITALAQRLGVTKGAISKMATKMREKGLIEKYQEPGNDKEILLRLTKTGRIACIGHEEHHNAVFGRIIQVMEDVPALQAAFLFQFLGMMEEVIDTCILEKESAKQNVRRLEVFL